jgi:hypothetical protein
MDWSWRGRGLIENVWKYNRRSFRPYVDLADSARENKHLPAMWISRSALVFILSGVRR